MIAKKKKTEKLKKWAIINRLILFYLFSVCVFVCGQVQFVSRKYLNGNVDVGGGNGGGGGMKKNMISISERWKFQFPDMDIERYMMMEQDKSSIKKILEQQNDWGSGK